MKRWPLYAAITYVVLLFVGLFILPTAPEVTASGAKLVHFYREHDTAIRVVAWCGTLSTLPIAVLLAHLRSRLSGTSRDVMLLGAAGLLSTTTLWLWFNAGLALHPFALHPNTARTLADIGAYFGPTLTVSIVLIVVPLGLAAWKGEGGLPRWFAWLSAVFATEQLIETITVMGRRGFIAPGGPMNLMLGAGLFAVWVIAAGVASSATPATPTT